jgi:LacI family transcriptional regulator
MSGSAQEGMPGGPTARGPVSMRQVAELAGVSVATVSNAINRPEIVTPKVRNRVKKAIRELGYVRNESARTLRTGRSDEIGLVVPDASSPFWGPVVNAADTAADDVDAVISLFSSHGDRKREQHIFQRLINHRVRGVLAASLDRETTALEVFRSAGIPFALLAQGGRAGDFCCVYSDDRVGGRLVGEHLMELGHRSVTFVGTRFPERLEGISGAVRAAGGTLSEINPDQLTFDDGYRAGLTIAGAPPESRTTSVACATDIVAIGLILALTEQGIRVPEDISVTGYDDIQFARAAMVPLTTVRQPTGEIGTRAIRLLNDEIAEGVDHHHSAVVFHPTLTIRRSTGAAPR